MLETLTAAIGNYVQPKDVVGPVVGGLLGYWGASTQARMHQKIAVETRLAAERASAKKERADAREAHADDLTNRFRVLMEGYECRITDLMAEVQSLRDEVKHLRQALDERTMACAGCPNFRERGGHDGID